MSPHDARTGWDDEVNAELYDRFTHEFPFYQETSTDLAHAADLHPHDTVLDLCAGTGATAAVILQSLSARGHVICLDSSPAMQTVGRRTRPDPRIESVCCTAEQAAETVPGPVDAVLCNAALWKTHAPDTFASIKRLLRPGGRFVFNIGGAFAGLTPDEVTRSHTGPSLTDLVTTIAIRDYGYVPAPEPARGTILTDDVIRRQLQEHGFTVLTTQILTHHSSMQEKRAWLSIPLFARPPGQLTHQQRLRILHTAYQEVDKTRPSVTRWLLVVAQG